MTDIKVFKSNDVDYHVNSPDDITKARNKAIELSKKTNINSVTVNGYGDDFARFENGEIVTAQGHFFATGEIMQR